MILLLFCFILLGGAANVKLTLVGELLPSSLGSRRIAKQEEIKNFIINKGSNLDLNFLSVMQFRVFLMKMRDLYTLSVSSIYEKLFFKYHRNYLLLIINVLMEAWLTLRHPQFEEEYFLSQILFGS
jgi:hypothetical protein